MWDHQIKCGSDGCGNEGCSMCGCGGLGVWDRARGKTCAVGVGAAGWRCRLFGNFQAHRKTTNRRGALCRSGPKVCALAANGEPSAHSPLLRIAWRPSVVLRARDRAPSAAKPAPSQLFCRPENPPGQAAPVRRQRLRRDHSARVSCVWSGARTCRKATLEQCCEGLHALLLASLASGQHD